MGERVSFGPWEVTVENILKYAEGISDKNERHINPENKNFIAPPLYAATFIIPGTAKILFEGNLNLNIARLVHGGIEINFHNPLKPGDKVTLYSQLQSIEEKTTGTLVNISFEGKKETGENVVSGITRYFVRGEGIKREKREERKIPSSPPDIEGTLEVSKDQSLKYAEGSGDRFPIHTDDNFAKSVGLPGMILHGMCTLALASRVFIDNYLKGDSTRLKKIGVRFAKYVLPGDKLTLRAWRKEKRGEIESFQFITLNQKGEIVLDEGIAEIKIS